jgi:hypothetical protein
MLHIEQGGIIKYLRCCEGKASYVWHIHVLHRHSPAWGKNGLKELSHQIGAGHTKC